MRAVGKLPILWPKGEVRQDSTQGTRISLVLDTRGRRAYELFDLCCTGYPPPDRIGIQSFDLDSLLPLRYATFPGQPWRVTDEWLVALDEERRRLFVPTLVNPLGVSEISGVAVVDLERFDRGQAFVAKRIEVPALQSEVRRLHLYGFNYFHDPSSGAGKLVLLFDQPGVVVVMVQWDVEKGTADWKYLPAACRQGWLSGPVKRVPVWRSVRGFQIYATCAVDTSRSAVLRVVLGKDGMPSGEQALVGPLAAAALFDPGTDRVVMLRDPGGWTAWVADGPTLSFVGAIGLTQVGKAGVAAGIDAAAGRFYFLASHDLVGRDDPLRRPVAVQGGLMLADVRLTPAPQALLFPAYSYPGAARIQVDPQAPGRPRRVFVWRGTERTEGGHTYPEGKEVDDLYPPEDFYLVIRDGVPAPRQPTLADLDRLTADRPEEVGVTGAAFDGLGSAYGARLRMIGGVNAATRQEGSSPTDSTVSASAEPLCWTTDREFLAGQVEEAHLSSVQANGTAGYLDADAGTKVDVEKPVSRCQPKGTPQKVGDSEIPWPFAVLDGVLGRPWPFTKAECVGDKGDQAEGKDSGGYPVPNDLYARADCKQGEERVSADAGGAPLSLGGVRVAESFSSVKVSRDAGGIRVTAEAVARGIELPGLRIESVRTKAESVAAGRTGTARTSFDRVVCGIYSQAKEVPGCVERERLDEIIKEINARVLGTRGRISLPQPDRESARGTPRGYAAGIRRDQNEALTAALLESDYQLEVPGLEVTLYRDSSYRGTGRQILMLAGVRAVTTYGIFLLPKGVDFPPLPAPELGPPPQAVGPLPTAAPEPRGPKALPAPAPAPPTIERVRSFLVRSLREGMLTSAVWLAIGLPFFLAVRRGAFARSFPREG